MSAPPDCGQLNFRRYTLLCFFLTQEDPSKHIQISVLLTRNIFLRPYSAFEAFFVQLRILPKIKNRNKEKKIILCDAFGAF